MVEGPGFQRVAVQTACHSSAGYRPAVGAMHHAMRTTSIQYNDLGFLPWGDVQGYQYGGSEVLVGPDVVGLPVDALAENITWDDLHRGISMVIILLRRSITRYHPPTGDSEGLPRTMQSMTPGYDTSECLALVVSAVILLSPHPIQYCGLREPRTCSRDAIPWAGSR